MAGRRAGARPDGARTAGQAGQWAATVISNEYREAR